MQIKSWSSPALQRHSHVLPPYAWLALFSSHTTGKRSSSLVCKYIDHCDHNSVLQVELCKPSNHMQTNTKHAGIIFLYLVPPDNVFLPVLCAVCGRSDAGLPIIGQIRSQLQRGVPTTISSAGTLLPCSTTVQALILLLHQVAHYCEGTTTTTSSAGTLLPLGTTVWVPLHLLYPVRTTTPTRSSRY